MLKLFDPLRKKEVQIRWIDLKDTNKLIEIERAVRGSELIAQKHVAHNPLLNEGQYRTLTQVFLDADDMSYLGILIQSGEKFPTDLLEELALSQTNNWVLMRIAEHPNATEEIRVITAIQRMSL